MRRGEIDLLHVGRRLGNFWLSSIVEAFLPEVWNCGVKVLKPAEPLLGYGGLE